MRKLRLVNHRRWGSQVLAPRKPLECPGPPFFDWGLTVCFMFQRLFS